MQISIGRLISILHRHAQIYMNYHLKEFEVTSSEYAFLLYLYKKDGITQEDLSAHMSIDKSATARAIKCLEKKGYITRNKDEADKRFNRVYLSDKALLYKDDITKRVWSWSEFLTEDLDEETIAIVLPVLQKMVEKVESANLKKEME